MTEYKECQNCGTLYPKDADPEDHECEERQICNPECKLNSGLPNNWDEFLEDMQGDEQLLKEIGEALAKGQIPGRKHDRVARALERIASALEVIAETTEELYNKKEDE